ncbi:MAG: hypothetical protein KDD35_06450 [Bdellovibrionales bacterium]|nr:hypothetical protein [Bdellovibrionales bacterium]
MNLRLLETVFYEAKPYLAIALAFITLFFFDVQSTVGKMSSLALILLGAVLIYSRLRERGIIKW